MTSARPSLSASSSTRRDFLKTTSVATAGAFAAARVASPARGFPNDGVDRSESLKIGIIGTGGMGRGHLNALMKHRAAGRETFDVIALCDVCKPRLDQAHKIASEKQEGVDVKSYRDHREMLKKHPELDAVWIASQEHMHSVQAIDAMRAGVDCYVEKPMTLGLDMALDLWREELGSDRIVQVGTQYTSQGEYHEARRLISEGAIGKPVFSQTSYCRNSKNGEWLYGVDDKVEPGEMLDWAKWLGPLGPLPFDTYIYHRWRRYRKFSTGIVGDLLVHKMTPMILALGAGWPVRVTATGGHYIDKAMENHDQVNLTVQFEDEHTMLVAGSTCNEQGMPEMIRGHEGTLYLGGNRCRLVPERIFVDDVEGFDKQFPLQDNPQHTHQLDFLRCVRTRETPTSTVEMGVKIMTIVDLATRSMWEGGAFGFSPASMTAYRI